MNNDLLTRISSIEEKLEQLLGLFAYTKIKPENKTTGITPEEDKYLNQLTHNFFYGCRD